MTRPRVFIALPQRPGESMANGLWQATQPGGMGEGFDVVELYAQPCSLLNNNFNDLWCVALNRAKRDNITHFVMVHSDVIPTPGRWVQTLLEEMERVEADVLSCVIALKDDTGMSSTGLMHWPSESIKKLSVGQCLEMPKTFDATDCVLQGHRISSVRDDSVSHTVDANPESLATFAEALRQRNSKIERANEYCLLVNTGCWICRITEPWARKLCFRSYDTIVEKEDGTLKAVSTGEDWLFSMDCYRLGLRVFATTAVPVLHQGIFRYPNNVAYGSKEGIDTWGNPWCVQAPPSWTAEEANRILPRRSGACGTSHSLTPSPAG